MKSVLGNYAFENNVLNLCKTCAKLVQSYLQLGGVHLGPGEEARPGVLAVVSDRSVVRPVEVGVLEETVKTEQRRHF